MNAQKVAETAIKHVRNGTKVNLSQIQRDVGYSESSVQAHKAIKTETYKEIIGKYNDDIVNEMKVANRQALSLLRQKLIALQEGKEKFTVRDVAYVIDLIQKNINLGEGKATENIAIEQRITSTEEAEEYLKQVL